MAKALSRVLVAALLCAVTPIRAQERRSLAVELGCTPAGEATPSWREALRGLRGKDPGPLPAAPPTAAEAAWAARIRERLPRWNAEVPDLGQPFAPQPAPQGVRVLLGLGGGEDAFSPDDRTLAFDLSRLAALYGDAASPENGARLDRFFRHEYTHVLQKAWLGTRAYPATTPLRAALLDLWKEGHGNFHSLSSRWVGGDGAPTEAARTALDRLAPRLVARMAALAAASPEAAPRLLAGLSMGPFEQKWGALPVALWLAEAGSRSPEAIRAFVLAGPDGLWDFVERHLPEGLRAVWREARAEALAGKP